MNTERTNIGWGFWLAWVLASIMGFGMGALIAMSVSYGLLPVLAPSVKEFDTTFFVVSGTVLGASGGFMQWLVLRERIPGSGLWVLASALGFAVAGVAAAGQATSTQNYLLAVLIFGALGGVAGGVMQWLVLMRAQVVRAGWWVLASIFGSLVSAIGVPAASAINAATDSYGLGAMVFGVLFGAGLGAIPGAALVWLLRQPQSSNIEGMATAP